MSARFLEPTCAFSDDEEMQELVDDEGYSCGDDKPCELHERFAIFLASAHARGVEEGITEAAMIVASEAKYITSEGVPKRLAAAIRRALRPGAEGGGE